MASMQLDNITFLYNWSSMSRNENFAPALENNLESVEEAIMKYGSLHRGSEVTAI